MTTKVIEVAGARAPSGWNWMLRSYSVIPRDSPAIRCALIGDLQGLQDLFTARQASPFDQVEDTGLTILYVSSLSTKYLRLDALTDIQVGRAQKQKRDR